MDTLAIISMYSSVPTEPLIRLSNDRELSEERQLIICDILYERIPDQHEFEMLVKAVLLN